MMAERGIDLTHSTILRWGQRYVPVFEKRWKYYVDAAAFSYIMEQIRLKDVSKINSEQQSRKEEGQGKDRE
jgi:transposase-like protein